MAGYDVASEIQGVIDSLKRDNHDLSEGARVKRAWNASVDNNIAKHVTAVFVVPHTGASEVIIYVDSSIWATELTMQSELLRLNLNIELNRDADVPTTSERKAEQVEKLTFKVSKDKYLAKERRLSNKEQLEQEDRRRRSVQPVALDEEEVSGLQEAAASIDNDELRAIAYSAAKASLEFRKGLEKLDRPA